MTRYKILDDLLSDQYHNYSLDDLTEEVSNRLAEIDPKSGGVVRRTIEKDIEYLEYTGPFLVQIERYTASAFDRERQRDVKKKCLRYEKPGYSIFKKEMTDDEKYLLSEALSMLGQFDGLPNLEGLENLRKSLGLIDYEQEIVSFTKNPLENSTLLGELFTAISHKQVVELHYKKFSDIDSELIVNLHPYLLKEYNRRWYLIAAAEDDDKLLNFALDRIVSVIPLPGHDYIEYKGDLRERFEDIVGVTLFDDKPLNKIVFWVSDFSKNYVLTKPIHESQRNVAQDKVEELRLAYPSLSGGHFLQIECRENYELIRELCSFGKDLLVLEPSIIRETVFDRIQAMSKEYEEMRI